VSEPVESKGRGRRPLDSTYMVKRHVGFRIFMLRESSPVVSTVLTAVLSLGVWSSRQVGRCEEEEWRSDTGSLSLRLSNCPLSPLTLPLQGRLLGSLSRGGMRGSSGTGRGRESIQMG